MCAVLFHFSIGSFPLVEQLIHCLIDCDYIKIIGESSFLIVWTKLKQYSGNAFFRWLYMLKCLNKYIKFLLNFWISSSLYTFHLLQKISRGESWRWIKDEHSVDIYKELPMRNYQFFRFGELTNVHFDHVQIKL